MNHTLEIDINGRRAALVTGGAGFIGSHVAEALHACGWHVEVLDNLSAGTPANIPAGVRLHVGDIRSREDLRRVFSAGHFDAVVHCAAQTSVERSMRDPDLDWAVNVLGTRRLATMAKASRVERFVLISSGGAIYGETTEPATEQTPPAPRSYYGRHKYAAERLILAGGLPHAILRPANVYGSRQRPDAEGGVIAIFLDRLLSGQPIDVHGGGRQVRDFVHVSDVVAAALSGLTTNDDVLWNVASGQTTSIIDLAEEIAAVTGRPLDVRHQPRRPGDVDRSIIDPGKLLATGRWGPPLSLGEGLRLTLAAVPEPRSAAQPVAGELASPVAAGP
jgi:UDP-glucose 4-epimerase